MTPSVRKTFDWPDAAVNRLRAMWADGHSAGHIARALQNGLTRSAVIGKIDRLGLPKRATRIRVDGLTLASSPKKRPKPKSMARAKRVTLPPLPINRPDIVADAPPAKAAAWLPLPGTSPKSLVDLKTRGECRWPIGENPTLFCGCATYKTDATYCEAHSAMAYRPLEKVSK